VAAVDRDSAALEALRQELPDKVIPFTCDLQDLEALKKTAEQVGAVDFLVNVAGIAIFQQFFDGTPEVWDKTMDINARATWFLSQQMANGMMARGGGAIVNMSSQSSSVVVSDRHLAYSTSKAAVDHITRSTAIALAKHGVRVNAVNPTVVRTELAVKAHGEDGLARMAAKVPLGRICEPNHVADVVLFLLSDRAAMITGVTLPVDGGFLAART
jgi:NAD(P)-dependent dehydrogenase (short-subunit alcohol dehydrogenase family)